MLTMKAEDIASSIWMSRCHLHGEDTRGYNMISPKYESPRCEPWCWHIYLQNWAVFSWLVVWNIWIIFHSVGNVIIPADEQLHHFSEG